LPTSTPFASGKIASYLGETGLSEPVFACAFLSEDLRTKIAGVVGDDDEGIERLAGEGLRGGIIWEKYESK